MTTEHPDLAPLKLFETSPGKHSLILGDDRMIEVAEVFQRLGHEGHGYDWETIARTVLALRAPELDGRMGFDPEAGMFCAYGTDEAALRDLGLILAQLFHDPAGLAEVAEAADPGAWD